MDKARLSSLVYKRTGIGLDPQDPAFAIVELNRAVCEELLEEAMEKIGRQLDALPELIRSSASAVVIEAARQAVQQIVETLNQSRRLIAFDAEQAQRRVEQLAKAWLAAHAAKPPARPMLQLLSDVAMLLPLAAAGFALGYLVGLFRLFG